MTDSPPGPVHSRGTGAGACTPPLINSHPWRAREITQPRSFRDDLLKQE